MYLLLMDGAIGVRKPIDQLVAAGVAKFAANQALKQGVVGLQALRARRQVRVIRDQAVAHRFQSGAMLAQRRQVARTKRSDDAANYQQYEDRPED